ERRASQPVRGDRVVRAALADRVVLQGTEVDVGLLAIQLAALRGGAGLGRDRHHDRLVPGISARQALAGPPLERRASSVVGGATTARTERRVPPGVQWPRTEIPGRPPQNARRHRQTKTRARRRFTPGIQSGILKNRSNSATSKSVSEEIRSPVVTDATFAG